MQLIDRYIAITFETRGARQIVCGIFRAFVYSDASVDHALACLKLVGRANPRSKRISSCQRPCAPSLRAGLPPPRLVEIGKPDLRRGSDLAPFPARHRGLKHEALPVRDHVCVSEGEIMTDGGRRSPAGARRDGVVRAARPEPAQPSGPALCQPKGKIRLMLARFWRIGSTPSQLQAGRGC